jgi:hypothetical protein
MHQSLIKIAIISYEDRGSFATENVADEDEILINILNELELNFGLEVWSDPKVNWSNYTHLLIKSPWDYFDRYEEFVNWCHHIQRLGLKVHNDLNTILWNTHKKYLLDIEELGFSIVPTQILPKGKTIQLDTYFEYFQTSTIIIKPAVSGGAKNTLKITPIDCKEKQKFIDEWIENEDFMVQPFMEEVEKTGEYSYVFFDNQFSHAVLKSAKAGDFRVQHFFGGKIQSITPNDYQLSYFNEMLKVLNLQTMYARFDGVWENGKFYLMELELIEPYLFLFTHPNAIENYKKAIISQILSTESA